MKCIESNEDRRIKIFEKKLNINIEFRVFLSTKNTNIVFSLDILKKTVITNFTITI